MIRPSCSLATVSETQTFVLLPTPTGSAGTGVGNLSVAVTPADGGDRLRHSLYT